MSKVVDKLQKKSDIARKAMQLFAEKGFVHTTVQDIADAIGAGKGTIYEYFATKEDLFLAAVEVLFNDYKMMILEDMAGAVDAADKLKILAGNSMAYMEKLEHLFGLFLEVWQVHTRNPANTHFEELIDSAYNDFRRITSEILAEGIEQGIFREDLDRDYLAISFISSLDGIGMDYIINRKKYDLQRVTGLYLDVFIRGIAV